MTYASGPGHLERDGQVSHNRRAKASASPKAAPRGRSRTTLGALAGPTISDISLAQTAGFSDRTTAANITSSAVTSGKPTMPPSSPFLESGEDHANVLTKSRHGCASFTGLFERWLNAGKPVNWYVVVALLWAAATCALTAYCVYSLCTYPWGG